MRLRIVIFAALLGACAPAYTFGQANLGIIGVKSVHGRYLQAHTDGELHASNEHRNEEETWFLIEVDKPNHIYALLNWRNGKFMSKRKNGCAPAVSTTLAPSEQWVLVSGRTFGVVNAIAFRNRAAVRISEPIAQVTTQTAVAKWQPVARPRHLRTTGLGQGGG